MTQMPLTPPAGGAGVARPAERELNPVTHWTGLLSWISSVDHKQIGIMYVLVSVFFFAVGGLEAMLIRIQLARPEMAFLTPQMYNQIFTMHGTTMIFLVVMPFL